MGLEIAEVERALLALDPEARAEVIRRGLRSLDEGDAAPEGTVAADEWRDELKRRADDVVEGRVELGTFAATKAEFERRHPRTAE